MYTALADSYSHLILKSDENRMLAVQFYEAALGTDPNYLPALERLLVWREDEAELFGGPMRPPGSGRGRDDGAEGARR